MHRVPAAPSPAVQVSEEVLEWTITNVYKENDEVGNSPGAFKRQALPGYHWFSTNL